MAMLSPAMPRGVHSSLQPKLSLSTVGQPVPNGSLHAAKFLWQAKGFQALMVLSQIGDHHVKE